MMGVLEIAQRRLRAVRIEIERLQAQEAVLLEIINEQNCAATRSSVKKMVLDYLHDGPSVAKTIVERAEADGFTLRRSTVAGLLSRLVRDGVATYDQRFYYIKPAKP